MAEKKAKKYNNSFHLRIHDVELLKTLEEIMTTGNYSSMNELLNTAVQIGAEKIYIEYGKRKIFPETKIEPELPLPQKIDNLSHDFKKFKLMQEDMFIQMNSIEAITATIFNTLRLQINGEPITEEMLDSGYLATLPDAYKEIKDNLIERFNRKLNKEKKE